MSPGQSFVHAKADEVTEPGEEGLQFQNDTFSQEKVTASRCRERISLRAHGFFPREGYYTVTTDS